MKTRSPISPHDIQTMNPEALAQHFLIDKVFGDDAIHFVLTEYDGLVVGAAMPVNELLLLNNDPDLDGSFFLEVREMGIVNIGGHGAVSADGVIYQMEHMSCTYLGKGTTDVSFSSSDAAMPAMFYMVSTPCDHAFPNRHITREEVTPADLTAAMHEDLPFDLIYIHEDGILSCKLFMGVTIVRNGQVLNSLPQPLHKDCVRVFCYFGLNNEATVSHSFSHTGMNVAVANHQVILSPPWNETACCYPGDYACVWAVAAENQPIGAGNSME